MDLTGIMMLTQRLHSLCKKTDHHQRRTRTSPPAQSMNTIAKVLLVYRRV